MAHSPWDIGATTGEGYAFWLGSVSLGCGTLSLLFALSPLMFLSFFTTAASVLAGVCGVAALLGDRRVSTVLPEVRGPYLGLGFRLCLIGLTVAAMSVPIGFVSFSVYATAIKEHRKKLREERASLGLDPDATRVPAVKPSGIAVTNDVALEPGVRLLANYYGEWHVAEVVELQDRGMVKVHLVGWESDSDMAVRRDQLQLLKDSAGVSDPVRS